MTDPYITYNGKTSSSLGLIVTDIRRPAPRKRIVRTQIPYSNYTPDFSRIAGRYIYDRRQLIYTFAVRALSPELLTDKLSSIEEWLAEAPAGVLTESLDTAHYYTDCTCDSIEQDIISPTAAKITATFTAYPYRRSTETQEQSFTVLPSAVSLIYTLSGSKPLRPFFTSSAEEKMYIIIGSARYIVPPGVTRYQITPIVFTPGSNEFTAQTTYDPALLKIECIDEVI